jgi:septal ring factor EnvC (AmiA/AmiB activator)
MRIKRVALALLLTCLLLVTSSYAQNSKGTDAPAPPTKNQIIVGLLHENDDARAYISTLETRESALEDEIKKADAAHAALTQTYKDALLELGELRATVKFQKDALTEREKQVAELRAERDDARAKLKKERRRELLSWLVTGAMFYLMRR